jgi:hypothetical protein
MDNYYREENKKELGLIILTVREDSCNLSIYKY